MKKEIWKLIDGYDDYEISNFGRVKSKKCGKEKIKRTTFNRGYERVILRDNLGNVKNYAIHRLVAIAFIPNPNNKLQVNHKNKIRSHNNVDNLEWNTSNENLIHKLENKDLLLEHLCDKCKAHLSEWMSYSK